MRSRVALLTALIVLLAPAAAAADQTFTVNSVGDGTKAQAGAVCETATPGECTMRAAIEAANADTEPDLIAFAPLFDGESGSAITLGTLLPEVDANSPLRIDGGPCTVAGKEAPCVAIKGVTGFATISVRANESTVEFVKFEGGSVGLRAFAQGGPGSGVKILGNIFTGLNTAIESTGTIGGSGNLIEDNTIEVPDGNNRGISIGNGPNDVLGNVITGSCCLNAIMLNTNASGNEIGGNDAASENVIEGFTNGAIAMFGAGASSNEVLRNRGENGGPFIGFYAGAFAPAAPVLAAATQSSVSGTADPGAVVRVFRKATESEGEIAGFLGEAEADINGNWKVSGFAAVPVGTFITATQTIDGGTSRLAEAVAAQADPPAPPSGCPAVPSACPPPRPDPPPDTTKPKVTIKKGPKARSKSRTAKFVFSANESGVKFECKLDKKPLARCYSPKTYKKLKPGKHVFRVLAVDSAGNVSALVKRNFTVLKK